jgi:hypothetical protein
MSQAKITLAVFLALLFTLTVINLATPTREFSENENRPLQQLPSFSWDALLDGDFTADFDSFVTDQFVLRDGWVGMKTLLERSRGQQRSGGVYFASDDYLIEMFDTVDADRYAKNLAFVGDFSRRVEDELGVPVRTLLAPTASMMLSDKLPRNAPEVDQSALLLQASAALPSLIDLTAALGRHSGEYIYYRTDHHWTSLGAYYAYADWREQTGRTAPPLDEITVSQLSDEFYGTTYSKANLYNIPPDVINSFEPPNATPLTVNYDNGKALSDSIYERSFLGTKDKYSVFLNANQPILRVETGVQNGERLLLIKDSYANTFAQNLVADYEEIVMIDLRYFHESAYNFIRDNAITEVLVLYNLKGFSGDTNLFYLSE